MAGNRSTAEAVIPSSGTDSATLTVPVGKRLVGFVMPAAFTGASISFKGAATASDTPRALYDDSNSLYSITVAADRFYAVDPDKFTGVPYLVFVSASSEGAERTIDVIYSD